MVSEGNVISEESKLVCSARPGSCKLNADCALSDGQVHAFIDRCIDHSIPILGAGVPLTYGNVVIVTSQNT